MPKSTKKLLEQIEADIIESNICPHLAQEANNLVMGVGDPNAKVLFVGEAPGKDEDIKGEPFVGRAGQVLNQALKANDLPRTSVYITNIVKYRPPGNRDPLPDEKKAFWPHLLREIKAVNPILIVPLGRHSMGYFLPNAVISKDHGKVGKVEIGTGDDKKIIKVMPIYHPAATIYHNKLRNDFDEDFKKIKDIIKLTKKEDNETTK